jgi:hypothetical protein
MTAKRPGRSSQVPGQYLGYSLQTTRALVRLLSAPPGSFVSVEVLDDVAESRPAGSTTLVQSKSVGARTNPIADRSPELWKTLANWVRGVKNGDIDLARTAFELFISKKRTGPLAHSFDSARTVTEAAAALATARAALVVTRGIGGKSRRKAPAALAPHLAVVFGDTSIAAEVISRISLVFGSGRSGADVLTPLRAKLISDPALELVAKQMLGWVKQTLDDLIEQGRPAVISTDHFNVELGAFVRRVDRSEILNCFAPPPTLTDVDLELRTRVYVQQLDLIGSDYDAKLAAARDFLRASVNRSVWAAKGLVHRTSFDELEDRLKRIWRAKRDAVTVLASQHAAESQGLLLYSECSQVDASLDGRPVPSHFGAGCYHAMADTLDIGWHPHYRERLGGLPRDSEDDGGGA